MLASLTAVVVVQVSVRESMRTALERSAAVVLGVLVALAIGDALELNAAIVAVLVASSLAVAELLLRLPRAAARQVPISVLVVLSAVSVSPAHRDGIVRSTRCWERSSAWRYRWRCPLRESSGATGAPTPHGRAQQLADHDGIRTAEAMVDG